MTFLCWEGKDRIHGRIFIGYFVSGFELHLTAVTEVLLVMVLPVGCIG